MKIKCHHCGKRADKPSGAVNRSRREGFNVYCSTKCSGLAHRKNRSADELKEAKRLYDADYKRKNAKKIKAQQAAYHKATYDPIKAAKERKKKMQRHVEYCRRPEYRKWKSGYDKKYRSIKLYGEFSEVYLTLLELTKAINERTTDYETHIQQGTYGKAQKRRRQDGAGKARRYRYRPPHGK